MAKGKTRVKVAKKRKVAQQQQQQQRRELTREERALRALQSCDQDGVSPCDQHGGGFRVAMDVQEEAATVAGYFRKMSATTAEAHLTGGSNLVSTHARNE